MSTWPARTFVVGGASNLICLTSLRARAGAAVALAVYYITISLRFRTFTRYGRSFVYTCMHVCMYVHSAILTYFAVVCSVSFALAFCVNVGVCIFYNCNAYEVCELWPFLLLYILWKHCCRLTSLYTLCLFTFISTIILFYFIFIVSALLVQVMCTRANIP